MLKKIIRLKTTTFLKVSSNDVTVSQRWFINKDISRIDTLVLRIVKNV